MKDLLVILHLHYSDQLDYFIGKLSNIQGFSWDLVVTGASQDAREKLSYFKKDTVFLEADNVGYDIWPFLYCVGKVNLKDYKVVFKLHSKNIRTGKSAHIGGFRFKGAAWRDTLVNSLLASPERVKEVVGLFDSDPLCGMVCSARLYTSMKAPEDCGMLDRELSRIGLNTKERRFCAGSMFAVRASVLEIIRTLDIRKELFPSGGQTNDGGTLSHVYERILSLLAPAQGLSVRLVDNKLCTRTRISLRSRFQKIFGWIFSLERKGDCWAKYLTLFGHSFRLDGGYYHPDATLNASGPAISVIVCFVNERRLKELTKSIDETVGVPWEMIPIDNREGRFSIFEAYNAGADKASGEVLCFCHEDISFKTEGWGWKLVSHFREQADLGLAGSAGMHGALKGKDCRDCPETSYNLVQQYRSASTSGLTFKYHAHSHYQKKALNDVVAVDGLWLALRGSLLRTGAIRFDEDTFHGFHQYDTDISFQVLDAGYRVCVCYDILVEHDSEGSFNKAYIESLRTLLEKWDDKLPFKAGSYDTPKMKKAYRKWEESPIWCTNAEMTAFESRQKHQDEILHKYNRAAFTIKDSFEEIDINLSQNLVTRKDAAKFKRKTVFYRLTGISSNQRKLNEPAQQEM